MDRKDLPRTRIRNDGLEIPSLKMVCYINPENRLNQILALPFSPFQNVRTTMSQQEMNIAVIGGDGIGPDVTRAAMSVVASTGLPVNETRYDAGDAVFEEEGEALPERTLEGARSADAVLFGAAGETAADVIIRLRQELDTFVNLRPTPIIPDREEVLLDDEIVIVRENTEGLYVGKEREVEPGTMEAPRTITRRASERIARFAFRYAEEYDHETVTAVHKSNVLQKTDGLFLECARSIAENYPDIAYEEGLVDAAAMRLVMVPERYDVILTTNLFGDILSDEIAGMVGGLGLCPSANIGDDHALFEPVHGSAPDLAGTGTANPSAAILCGAMMVRHLGHPDEANRIETALEDVISEDLTTPDQGGSLTTDEMTEEVIDRL